MLTEVVVAAVVAVVELSSVAGDSSCHSSFAASSLDSWPSFAPSVDTSSSSVASWQGSVACLWAWAR